ncbi:A24 family peptidase [Paenibacillus hexagrammi]|uniref:Prepilin peptidase n=1 Tax=Paenibacillus hexagrammi TaxID=2908839 RepID=A0ABY3SGJ0_9BACL|nr:prepilin peptidase [Paenibacillus sp. YPD9-1]UJF32839.1 prepilin peptidase [Paenibacillus sp. YPD9-1]
MLFTIMLLTVLLISVVTDVRSRKIHNKVIFPGIAAALGAHTAMAGWTGLGASLAGFLAGLGVLLIPYLLGGIGAGDVKLLALVGAMKGTSFVLMTSVYMALIGAILAVLVIVFRNGAMIRMKWIGICMYSFRYGVLLPVNADKTVLTATYPYGVAIAGGALVCLWFKGW